MSKVSGGGREKIPHALKPETRGGRWEELPHIPTPEDRGCGREEGMRAPRADRPGESPRPPAHHPWPDHSRRVARPECRERGRSFIPRIWA